MKNRNELVDYCNNFLSLDKFSDYSKNGLQVEGSMKVKKIITGVSACLELFEKAVEEKADMIIVHHGLLWNDVNPIVGVFKKRIKILLDNNISLLAYHLPLDANPDLGNNVLLSKEIGLKNTKSFLEYNGNKIGFKGEVSPTKFSEFLKLVERKVGPIVASVDGAENVNKVGICSGGASREVETIAQEKIDTYITGEIGESTIAYCKEAKLNYIALGHYNSEIWGVRELGNHLNKKFNLPVEFIKVENPY